MNAAVDTRKDTLERLLAEEARISLEVERRQRAQRSLVEYARFVEIPGAPVGSFDSWSDEDLADLNNPLQFTPVETEIVTHHRVILEELQACMERPNGRLMVIAPPGSAKSTMAAVLATTWAMGRWPGYKILLTSYASRLTRKHSRRALQLTRSRAYRSLWDERPVVRRDVASADDWAFQTGSEYMAAGILAGITGNRHNGAICDDLIAGRLEAESPNERARIMEAYRDDVESRLLPNGWVVLINTRWHQDDPCGQLLPEDYDGRSGDVVCRDGRVWRVLNIPAKAERADDPVGRAVGEYLWSEWFPREHWQGFENDPLGQRRWNALYQGRPTGATGEDFKREDAQWYENDSEIPKELTIYGASDFAVTDPGEDLKAAGRVDWTEHGLIGMDAKGELWFLDWWSGQKETDVAIDAMLDFVPARKPMRWWHEGGVIDKAISPALRKRMRERSMEQVKGKRTSYYVQLEPLSKIADKRAKCQSFAARYSARTCHFPRNKPWAHQVIDQLVNFGAARHDDKYDVCGLIGRGIDQMLEAPQPPEKRAPGVKPFSKEWLEYEEPKPQPRYR